MHLVNINRYFIELRSVELERKPSKETDERSKYNIARIGFRLMTVKWVMDQVELIILYKVESTCTWLCLSLSGMYSG